VGLERIIFASDLHGDLLDDEAVDALYAFTKEWKPHHKIFGGDLFDFRPLRRGASAEERAETIQHDLGAGLKFLSAWKPDYWLRGNHDERLWDFAQHDGIEGEFAKLGVTDLDTKCKIQKIKTFPYCKRKGVLKMGNLTMIHGYFTGVNAARQHGNIYGSCLFGHVHSIDVASMPNLNRVQARAVGCLCRLDHPYNARLASTLRHAHGWAYGVINNKTGDHKIWQMEKIGGKFLGLKNLIEIG
jgi:hypothetical protein